MTEYAVLLPGDECAWADRHEEHRAAMYAMHGEFARLLDERGHKMTGGSELTHSREARVVRGDRDGITVTEGPYAETVEQLTGFYIVETDDLDDLLEVCSVLAGAEGADRGPRGDAAGRRRRVVRFLRADGRGRPLRRAGTPPHEAERQAVFAASTAFDRGGPRDAAGCVARRGAGPPVSTPGPCAGGAHGTGHRGAVRRDRRAAGRLLPRRRCPTRTPPSTCAALLPRELHRRGPPGPDSRARPRERTGPSDARRGPARRVGPAAGPARRAVPPARPGRGRPGRRVRGGRPHLAARRRAGPTRRRGCSPPPGAGSSTGCAPRRWPPASSRCWPSRPSSPRRRSAPWPTPASAVRRRAAAAGAAVRAPVAAAARRPPR